MRDKCVVEIIDVNERFESGIVFNFGRIVDKVGTYRNDLISKFNDTFVNFIDKNSDFFDRLYDIECMIDDRFDDAIDKSIDYIDRVIELIPKQSQNDDKKDKPFYELKSMGYYDDSFDDEIFEFKEFKLEDYDTDEYKVVRRGR